MTRSKPTTGAQAAAKTAYKQKQQNTWASYRACLLFDTYRQACRQNMQRRSERELKQTCS